MWPITLSGRLPIAVLVGRYLTNELIGRELTPQRIAPLTSLSCDSVVLCGISNCFQLLSPSVGQIAHALLTHPPLECQPKPTSSFDLHVLSTPPAFVLSQDQTLLFNPSRSSPRRANVPSTNSISTLSRIDCSLASRSLYRFQGSRCRSLDNEWDYTRYPAGCQYLFSTFLNIFFSPAYISLLEVI